MGKIFKYKIGFVFIFASWALLLSVLVGAFIYWIVQGHVVVVSGAGPRTELYNNTINILLCVATVIFLTVVYTILIIVKTRYQFLNKHRKYIIGEDIALTLTAETLIFESDDTKQSIHKKDLYRIVEQNNIIYIVSERYSPIAIPSRLLDQQQKELLMKFRE